jgi:hypothetical protein
MRLPSIAASWPPGPGNSHFRCFRSEADIECLQRSGSVRVPGERAEQQQRDEE